MEGQPTSDLAEQLAELRDRVDDLEDDLEKERRRRREAEQDRDRLQERVDDLEARVDEGASIEWDSNDRDDLWIESADGTRLPLGQALKSKVSEYDLEKRVDDLVDRLDAGDLADEPESGPSVNTETPLEDVVALPENIAEQELSANQHRARFIASSVRDYAGKTTGGYALASSDVRKILKAGCDVEGHAETVRRVIQMIDRLGKDTVRVKKRNGERRLHFDEQAANRLTKLGELETHVSVSPVEG